MDTVYLVFRVHNSSLGNPDCIFLAACSSKASAMQYCQENGFITAHKETIYTTRSAAQLILGKGLVIEKVAVINYG